MQIIYNNNNNNKNREKKRKRERKIIIVSFSLKYKICFLLLFASKLKIITVLDMINYLAVLLLLLFKAGYVCVCI